MSPETLLQQFDVVAEAPDGVRKLRELILQLAVRGKLVPQDPSDEPASVLLERIAMERQRLYTQGKVKRSDHLAPVSQNEAPFEVPDGWAWVRIGQSMDLVNGRAFKPTEWSTTGIPIVRIQNLNNADAIFNYCAFEVPDKFYIDNEDLLLSWSGTPGTSFGAFVWRMGRAVLNQHIFRCDLYDNAYTNDFARLAINGRLTEMIAQAHGGVGLQHVTKGKLEKLAIVLPPLSEQRRIVAKVDELMALCDELEARQQWRALTRARLNRSALHHLTAATDDSDIAEHWQRLGENFDLLYDTPETVAELRQAVLQLAVRGRLVPQDASEEPASVLLERIAAERHRLFQEGKISKPKALPPISEDELPFEVPEGWAWVRLGTLTDPVRSLSYGVLVPGPDVETGVPFVRVQDITGRSYSARPNKAIDPLIEAKYARTRLEGGEILIGVVGSIGAIGVAPDSWKGANIARALCRFAPAAGLDREFLTLVLRSPLVQEYFLDATRTLAQPTLNVSQLELTTLPLPPLREQQRIVARVNELMALCDELEARLTSAREKASHLAASVVHHVAAA